MTDNLMLLLTVRNVKRAGDVPHLLIRQVESMEIPEKDTVVEFQIAKHKTAGAGKPSPLKVSIAELVQLKQFAAQTKLRAESRGLESSALLDLLKDGQMESNAEVVPSTSTSTDDTQEVEVNVESNDER